MTTDAEKRERLREHAPMLLALVENPRRFNTFPWMSDDLRARIESYNAWVLKLTREALGFPVLTGKTRIAIDGVRKAFRGRRRGRVVEVWRVKAERHYPELPDIETQRLIREELNWTSDELIDRAYKQWERACPEQARRYIECLESD